MLLELLQDSNPPSHVRADDHNSVFKVDIFRCFLLYSRNSVHVHDGVEGVRGPQVGLSGLPGELQEEARDRDDDDRDAKFTSGVTAKE